MKGSKLLMSLLVFVLITAFTFTTVGAQGEIPPVGEVDEDGDLVEEITPSLTVDARQERHDVSGYTIKYGDDISPDGTVVTEGTPYSPVNEWTLNKTPKFWFTKTIGATKYMIELRYWFSADLVYTFKGVGDCNDVPGYCWLKPDTKLKVYEYFNWDYGDYMWRVGAKVGDTWIYSGYYEFGVLSKGFDSTFDTDMKKWFSISNTWYRVDPGYLKTPGYYNLYSSAMQKEYFLDDYKITAWMKGKAGGNQYQGLVFGTPEPLWGPNIWQDGVYYLYSGGYSGVLFIKDGVQTSWTGWIESPNANPTGWNKLQVVVDSPNATFYINDIVEWTIWGATEHLVPGYVGLAHVKYTTEKAPLLVDRVKISYITTSAAALDLSGAKVIDLNQLPPSTGQPAGVLAPPQ